MDELEGQILTSINGTKYYLSKIIGQGAQGIIYSTADDEYVVKLYKKESELKNKKKLKKLNWLLKTDYPDQFIKPLDIIDSPYIGYVMKKVKGHVSLNKLLIPNRGMAFSDWYNQETGGLYRRLLVGQKIAMQFANLHKLNLAYCDLSGNNILVNENTDVNSVCMIDIDNIYIPGADEVNVLGTSRYMAPEILTKQLDPDIFTDSYSLAVILFELLKSGHPYIGDFIEDGTPEQMTEAYKGLYPYVEDPANDLNRSSQMLPSDVVFTTTLKELFQKTFIDGKENRVSRIRAQEYALAFQRASNLVVKCSECGNWHYAKPDENHEYKCPWCDAPYEKPMRIAFYEKYAGKIAAISAQSSVFGKCVLYLSGIVICDFVASVATAPFALYHFHKTALYTGITNLLSGPIIAFFLMPVILLSLVLLPFGIGFYPLKLLEKGVEVINFITEKVSSLPHSVLCVDSLNFWGLMLIVAGGLWICIWQQKWRRWGILPIIIGVVTMFFHTEPDMVVAYGGQGITARDNSGKMIELPLAKTDGWTRKIWQENLQMIVPSGQQKKQLKEICSGITENKDWIDLQCDAEKCTYKNAVELRKNGEILLDGKILDVKKGAYIYLENGKHYSEPLINGNGKRIWEN